MDFLPGGTCFCAHVLPWQLEKRLGLLPSLGLPVAVLSAWVAAPPPPQVPFQRHLPRKSSPDPLKWLLSTSPWPVRLCQVALCSLSEIIFFNSLLSLPIVVWVHENRDLVLKMTPPEEEVPRAPVLIPCCGWSAPAQQLWVAGAKPHLRFLADALSQQTPGRSGQDQNQEVARQRQILSSHKISIFCPLWIFGTNFD